MVLYLAWQAVGQPDDVISIFFFGFFAWFASAVILLMAFKPPKLSHRGKRYVKAMQKHYKPTLSPQVSDGKTADALFAVGIMGVPILAGTMFSDFGTLFSTGTVSGSGCGGGCSCGCGGGCSGCGGGCGD